MTASTVQSSAVIVIPIRTGNGLNDRGHWRAKAKRVKTERQAVAWALSTHPTPPIPLTVLLTRVGPSAGLDDDNLPGALKAVRDQIATWLGVDDRKREIVRYAYAQERGKEWGVRVEWKAGVA